MLLLILAVLAALAYAKRDSLLALFPSVKAKLATLKDKLWKVASPDLPPAIMPPVAPEAPKDEAPKA